MNKILQSTTQQSHLFARSATHAINYFHSNHLPLSSVKKGLSLLKGNGMTKLTLHGSDHTGDFISELVSFSKKTLKLEQVHVVSDGKHITEDWMYKNAAMIDTIGVSTDSLHS